jgi:hypothetical protein
MNKGEKEIRRIANSLARSKGYGRASEIEFAHVKKPKIISADSFHWETKGGRIIHHPSAYAKVGFSNMVYCYAYCHVLLPYSVIPWDKI